MKTAIFILLGSLMLLFASFSWAGCGDSGGCSSSSGGCGDSTGSAYESNCQCTDPTCNSPWDSNCINRAYCCEAFGNVGGR